jgi:hypothetical protein
MFTGEKRLTTLLPPSGPIIKAYCAKCCAKSSGRSVTIASRSSDEARAQFFSNRDLQEIRVCGWVADAFPGVELVIINAELD